MALKVKLILDNQVSRGLTKVGAQIKSLSIDFIKYSAIATAAIAGTALKLETDLEYGLAEISTLMTDITDRDVKRMRSELQKLGRDSGQAIKPLLKARYDIVSAGFVSAAQSAMVLNQSVKLAVGGVTSAAQAADIMTTALNSYSYAAEDSAYVSDILFTTVRLGKTTMNELATSMGQMLPIARASNVSLADASASLALVTANGLDTAIAATALKNGFKALAAPSNHAKQALADAGITLKYLNDGTLDLIKTMEQFKGRDFSEFRDLIPDIRAINALLLMANNLDRLNSFMQQTRNSAGATEVAFDKMMNTFKVKGQRILRSLETPMQELGAVLIKKLTPFVDEAIRILGRLGDIGWDKIFADISNRWTTFSPLFQNLLTATLSSVPILFKHFFGLAVQAGITAFKIGWATGISINDLIASSFNKGAVKEMFTKLGDEATLAFFRKSDWSSLGGDVQKAFEDALNVFETGGVDIAKQVTASDLLSDDLSKDVRDRLFDAINILQESRGAKGVVEFLTATDLLPNNIGKDVKENVEKSLLLMKDSKFKIGLKPFLDATALLPDDLAGDVRELIKSAFLAINTGDADMHAVGIAMIQDLGKGLNADQLKQSLGAVREQFTNVVDKEGIDKKMQGVYKNIVDAIDAINNELGTGIKPIDYSNEDALDKATRLVKEAKEEETQYIIDGALKSQAIMNRIIAENQMSEETYYSFINAIKVKAYDDDTRMNENLRKSRLAILKQGLTDEVEADKTRRASIFNTYSAALDIAEKNRDDELAILKESELEKATYRASTIRDIEAEQVALAKRYDGFIEDEVASYKSGDQTKQQLMEKQAKLIVGFQSEKARLDKEGAEQDKNILKVKEADEKVAIENRKRIADDFADAKYDIEQKSQLAISQIAGLGVLTEQEVASDRMDVLIDFDQKRRALDLAYLEFKKENLIALKEKQTLMDNDLRTDQQKMQQFSDEILDKTTKALTGFYQFKINKVRQNAQEETRSAENSASWQIRNIEDEVRRKVITEEQGAQQIAMISDTLANKKRDIANQAHDDEVRYQKKQQKIASAVVIMDTAIAIMGIWKKWSANPIYAGILTALTASVGAAQLATINSQSFAFGGDVRAQSDTVRAYLTPGEKVLTKEASSMHGAEVDRWNQEASGFAGGGTVGGGGGGGDVYNITIPAVDGESVYRTIINNKDKFAKGFKEVVKSGHLQMAGR